MVQSPSWEANWFAASQEIPRISRNPKVHYRTHKRPPHVSILGQPNPVHIPTSHLMEIHPNIIHPSTLKSYQWPLSLRFPHQDPIHSLIGLTYLLPYLLTYSMVQSPSWEANWFVASQEIPRISREPKVHYRTHKRPPPLFIRLGDLQGESLASGLKLLSMYTVEQREFLVRKYWQTGSFKACQLAFRMEFGERRAPSKCCIQKLVKKLQTRGSRSNACRLLSLWPIEGQSVQKYTPYNRTTQRLYTPRYSSCQRRHLGKETQNLEKSIEVCLDVKGDQFQHRLWAGPVLHRSRFVYIDFQVIISIT